MTQVVRAAVNVIAVRHLQILKLISGQAAPPPSGVTLRRFGHFRARGLRLPREAELLEKTKQGSISSKTSSKTSSSGSDNENDNDDGDDATKDEKKKKKTRNEMKREARQAVGWGMELASFSAPQIQRILQAASLDKQLFEALLLVKKLGPDVREGKRRQFNYIGKLLRDAQPDLLPALIQATKEGDHSRLQALAASANLPPRPDLDQSQSHSEHHPQDAADHIILANKWYDGLIRKDIQITNEVYSVDSVEFDRQELRRLVRKVHGVLDGQRSAGKDIEKDAVSTAAKSSLNRFLRSLAKRLSSAPSVIV